MNAIKSSILAVSIALAAPAFADDAHHPEKKGAAPSVAAQMGPQVQRMQENTKRMQLQLEQLGKAKTDAERQRLMAEHLKTMQENMTMARGMQAGMGGCPMMGGGMGMGMMGGSTPGTSDITAERLQQMEKRMDMMQMMMGQMGARQGGMPPGPPPAAK